LQHILEGKELNRANVFVIEPRMTRTAAHATEYVRIRSGTDIPVIYGMLWHIFKNGWEDKQFIEQRVYGMDDIRKEVEKYPPDEVERITGVPEAQLKRVAETFAKQRPSTIIWCMGATQHTVGTANVRAFCIALLATGNVGMPGAGANIFRGHTNVQGATDLGLDIVTLPLYYGLAPAAWAHWSRVWEEDFEWLKSRFDNPKLMNTPGIPSTRWHDATLMPKDKVAQTNPLKCMFVMGHGGNTVTRMPETAKAIAALDLLVVADPHPTTWAVLGERKDGTYLLPVATSYETNGSRVASNRAMQWGEQIVKPIFESRDDNEIMYLLAKKLGFADRMFRNIKVDNNLPSPEDILREINRGGWSTGYCGQSPERLKSHMANQKDFDMRTQMATTGPNKGDYYGLPWPCWGAPDVALPGGKKGHPGTPILYNTTLPVSQGGGTFRARFGLEREEKLPDGTTRKVSLLGNGYFSKDSEIKDGYPEFTYAVLQKLGWDKELTPQELATIQKIGGANPGGVSWSIDLSGGIQRIALNHNVIPYGNGKARANAFGLPDAIPTHREPIYTPRAELVSKYPTLPSRVEFRVPNIGFDVQKAAVEKGIAKQFPLICTSGRLVEYEGGGEETRSNKWLAELQQDAFIEINPADAAERGIKDGAWCLVSGPEMPNGRVCRVKALVTERVGKGATWMPFHFAGWFMNVDQRNKYPAGTDPIVLGESVNTVTTYGYDPVTGMQEPKATLCQVRAA
jgi:formate dehydrogenase major subunit